MNQMYRIIGSVILLAYISGILLNSVSSKQLTKSIKLVIALYVVSLVIVPLKTFDINFDNMKNDEVLIDYEESQNYIAEQSSIILNNKIENILSEENIYYRDVDLKINNTKEKLYIEKIFIYGSLENDSEKIKILLQDYINENDLIFGE